MFRLDKKSISAIKNQAGVYRIYSNKSRHPVYVGSSKILRHRLQSYYEKDDYTVNRTKRALRPHANRFTFSYYPITKARRLERMEKQRARYNVSK